VLAGSGRLLGLGNEHPSPGGAAWDYSGGFRLSCCPGVYNPKTPAVDDVPPSALTSLDGESCGWSSPKPAKNGPPCHTSDGSGEGINPSSARKISCAGGRNPHSAPKFGSDFHALAPVLRSLD
jgi:hypothetical protein